VLEKVKISDRLPWWQQSE